MTIIEDNKTENTTKLSMEEVNKLLEQIETTELVTSEDLAEQKVLEQEVESRLLDCKNRQTEAERKRYCVLSDIV